MMQKAYMWLALASVHVVPIFAQSEKSALFTTEEPLSVRLEYSFKEIRNETVDTVYFPAVLHYRHLGQWNSVPVRIRGRGNWRRNNCQFTPIRIKIKKKDAVNTIFEDDRDLKLVLPCKEGDQYNTLIMKEYLCYHFYQAVTEYCFNTRLLNITLADQKKKKDKRYPVTGFFLEEDKQVAKRVNGKVRDEVKLHPYLMHDTTTTIHDFFSFMIGNTDFSTTFQHNDKIIEKGSRIFIPVPYDFDMCGFVDAPYATVHESIDIVSVRQRFYKGYCRNEAVAQFVRSRFLQAKPEMLSVLERYRTYFDDKDLSTMNVYLENFFAILEDDDTFDQKILSACRTPGN